MFVYNFKLNSEKIVKIIFVIAVIIVIAICGIAIFKLVNETKKVNINDEITQIGPYKLTAENYTNILKAVHDNMDQYLGQEITFQGYVYRVSDINENQFILARDMIISSNLQTLVVGFLCECENGNAYADGDWINITGVIEKGDYYGDIPVIKINKIEKINPPQDVYVYPPDNSFLPTSVLI